MWITRSARRRRPPPRDEATDSEQNNEIDGVSTETTQHIDNDDYVDADDSTPENNTNSADQSELKTSAPEEQNQSAADSPSEQDTFETTNASGNSDNNVADSSQVSDSADAVSTNKIPAQTTQSNSDNRTDEPMSKKILSTRSADSDGGELPSCVTPDSAGYIQLPNVVNKEGIQGSAESFLWITGKRFFTDDEGNIQSDDSTGHLFVASSRPLTEAEKRTAAAGNYYSVKEWIVLGEDEGETKTLTNLHPGVTLTAHYEFSTKDLDKLWGTSLTDFPQTWVYQLPFDIAGIPEDARQSKETASGGTVVMRQQIIKGCAENDKKAYAVTTLTDAGLKQFRDQGGQSAEMGAAFNFTFTPAGTIWQNGMPFTVNGQTGFEMTWHAVPVSTSKYCGDTVYTGNINKYGTASCYIAIENPTTPVDTLQISDAGNGNMRIKKDTFQVVETYPRGTNDGFLYRIINSKYYGAPLYKSAYTSYDFENNMWPELAPERTIIKGEKIERSWTDDEIGDGTAGGFNLILHNLQHHDSSTDPNKRNYRVEIRYEIELPDNASYDPCRTKNEKGQCLAGYEIYNEETGEYTPWDISNTATFHQDNMTEWNKTATLGPVYPRKQMQIGKAAKTPTRTYDEDGNANGWVAPFSIGLNNAHGTSSDANHTGQWGYEVRDTLGEGLYLDATVLESFSILDTNYRTNMTGDSNHRDFRLLHSCTAINENTGVVSCEGRGTLTFTGKDSNGKYHGFTFLFPNDDPDTGWTLNRFSHWNLSYSAVIECNEHDHNPNRSTMDNLSEIYYKTHTGEHYKNQSSTTLDFQKSTGIIVATRGIIIDKYNPTTHPADATADWDLKPYTYLDSNGETVTSSSLQLVPWQINLDISNAKRLHNDANWGLDSLDLYEDWVNADSDGSTEHMWYTDDTVGITIQRQTCTDEGACSWIDLQKDTDYSVYAAGSTKLPESDGETRPDVYHVASDKYALHKGSPRMRIKFNGRISDNLRIRYYTVFDGKPDIYRNWAKFQLGITGESKEYTQITASSDYVYNQGLYVGKGTDMDHYGKDYWTDYASRTLCSQVNEKDEDGYVDGKSDECWTTDWTVWANGVKPWGHVDGSSGRDYWADLLSGTHNLRAKTISFSDTLPQGWRLTPGTLRAYLVTPERDDEGNRKPNNPEDVVTQIEIPESALRQTTQHGSLTLQLSMTFEDEYSEQGKEDETKRVKCAKTVTYGTTTWEYGNCPVNILEQAIVKFEYQTYLPYTWAKNTEQLDDNGEPIEDESGHTLKLYEDGKTFVVDNKAEVELSGVSTTTGSTLNGQATATASIYHPSDSKDAITKQLSWSSTWNKGIIPYTITLNPARNLDLFSSGSATVIDKLDDRAKYNRTSLSIVASRVLYDNLTEKKTIDQFSIPATGDNGTASVAFGIDPQTDAENMSITIPKNATKPDGTEVILNKDWTIVITYKAQYSGLPGQILFDMTNSATLSNENSAQGYSASSTLGSLSIANTSSSAYFSSLPALRKTDADDNTKALQGAEFELRSIDLSGFSETGSNNNNRNTSKEYAALLGEGKPLPTAKDSDGNELVWSAKSCTSNNGTCLVSSGDDGKIALPDGLSSGSIYAIKEIQAPEGYQLDETERYIIYGGNNTNYVRLINIVNNINREAAANKDPSKRIQLHPLTAQNGTTDLIITNMRIRTINWQKIDSEYEHLDEETHTAKSGFEVLAGSEWQITSDDSTGSTCSLNDTYIAGLLPCRFYVGDGHAASAVANDRYSMTNGRIWVADIDEASGKLGITGLRNDVIYTLTEVKAPEGYNLDDFVFRFKFDDDGNAIWLGQSEGESATYATPYTVVDDAGTSTGEVVITNTPGVVLPSTGSTGPSRIARILGMMLLVLSAGYTVYLMRKRDQSPLSLS